MNLGAFGSFIVFVVVLGGLVFIHELGHFLTAKRLGVPVEEFGFGFPPRLFGIVRGADGRWRKVVGPRLPKPGEYGPNATIYSINAIPIGGFVRPAGEDDPSVPGGLSAAPKRVRVAVLAAGPIFNIVFAFLIFFIGFRVGWPDRVIIDRVQPGTPAAAAGLLAEDIVLTAAGTDIHYTNQLSEITYRNLGQPVNLLVQRGDQKVNLEVTPRREWPSDQGPMGIEMRSGIVTNYSVPQAAGRSVQEMWYQFATLVELPGRLLRGEVPLEAARPIGVVGLNDVTRAAVETAQAINQWFPVLQLIGMVSVALAITNLLPLPALDGGRILFVLIEAVRGRRLDPAREGMVHLVGMLVLLALMVVITYQDIFHPVIPR